MPYGYDNTAQITKIHFFYLENMWFLSIQFIILHNVLLYPVYKGLEVKNIFKAPHVFRLQFC